MKLDIGCGKEKVEGYVGVDLYEPTADIKDDITTLATFEDNSIDEIRTFHTLEHLFEKDVIPALQSMYRVLKPDGHIHIQVPDLLWVLEDFLRQRDEDRWGWKLQTIFGLQREDNPIGELHKTGFSHLRLKRLMVGVGFADVHCQSDWSEKYNQYVINGKGLKPIISDD